MDLEERRAIPPVILLAVIQHARINVMDDSSDEDTVVLEKVDNFAEETVFYMTDEQFRMHFRMTPATFEDLVSKVHVVHLEDNNEQNKRPGGFPRTPLEKEVMIMVWSLSNVESFRSVADRFGISKSTCWDILYRTCKLLLKVNTRYGIIHWPGRERQQIIRNNFQRNGFPGIIGCIDGCHIPITAPKENHVSYINRKNFHSVLLQGVCDHNRLFTDVYAGEAGSIHDYTLYRRSPLFNGYQNEDIPFYDDNHIIGDLAYKLDTNLLVGFKNNGHLTDRQKNYNYILSKARVIIENAFGLLKGRFRRLKMLETVRLDLISLLIVSACILHNICILKCDFLEDIIDLEAEVREIRINPENFRDIDIQEENNNARIKRNNIVNALPMLRREQN